MDNATPFQPWAANDSAKNVKAEREVADDANLHRENVNHPKHTQTASYDKETVTTVDTDVSGPSNPVDSGIDSPRNRESNMDSSKIASMQQIVENTLSQESRLRVSQLLEAVEALSGTERLLLYLRLPTGIPVHDPLKQPINPLGSRAELQQTVTWIQTHLEVDPDVSLPKQDVYDEYIAHCMSSNMKPLSTADFGKVMKQVYPSVRPRRLGTRGNSRYCYAGLRKKIKLEVPQLPDLGEALKEPVPNLPNESERAVCDWAETKLGMKFATIAELSRHVMSMSTLQNVQPSRPASGTPPLLIQTHESTEETGNTPLMKLKRKIQTQGMPGRPKKNKGQMVIESPPSTSTSASYITQHPSVKHESEVVQEPGYGYQTYMPVYDTRAQYTYVPPPRAHPPHPPPPVHDYRPDPYFFETPYTTHDLADAVHNLPINLSSDASLDLSTERSDWQRRRPPEPPPARLPLPGKKLILETYQSETQGGSPRSTQIETRISHHTAQEFSRTEYLPKKMRAAESLGGKLAASRHSLIGSDAPSVSAPISSEQTDRSNIAFLEDPKNVTNRSKSTAAALAREEQEAASLTQSVKTPTPKSERNLLWKSAQNNVKETSPKRTGSPKRTETPDSCCGLDGINIKTGMICEEKHSEILNRERVISICNIDKHDLDDYLNEGNSQEHEEELLKYFHQRASNNDSSNTQTDGNVSNDPSFLEAGLDPQDEHSQGKSEKISQLRELLAKNLKSQSGPNSHNVLIDEEIPLSQGSLPVRSNAKLDSNEGSLKIASTTELINGPVVANHPKTNISKHCNSTPNENGVSVSHKQTTSNQLITGLEGPHLYNGDYPNVPHSPTTRTQQYDFVPISDGCHSPRNFCSKSPLGFGQRDHSPSKNKPAVMGGSLQTSPISHSTAASPFVSPRNTPVPRSRFCSRPIPKLNGRKRRNPLSLGVNDTCTKLFAMPNEQKFITKTAICNPGIKYSQPMSAPPSPNILSVPYKSQMFPYNSRVTNGNLGLNFMPSAPFRESINGELAQPLSADPLSNEVSQFFREPIGNYRIDHDTSFRSQSVPLKQGINSIGIMSYNNTPAGSVPPTPVPNEFCDFGSIADTCDISKAGLNPETLDKIYDAIDSSNEVLATVTTQNLLNSGDTLTNNCDQVRQQHILTYAQLNNTFEDNPENDDVDDFLKRTNIIEFDLSELVNDKSKYYTSRSVPSTPLPYKRSAPNLQIESRRLREIFTAENFADMENAMSSKSVPSTPQLTDDRSVFNYSNRDFLINGNSLEVCSSAPISATLVDRNQGLSPPLHDILREDITEPLTPAADLLDDLDKIDGTSYGDI